MLLAHPQGIGTGDAYYRVVDETKTTGHTYKVGFLDTQVDSIDNNNNGLMDLNDSTEWNRITTVYSVRDLTVLSEDFTSTDTMVVTLQHKNFVQGTVNVFNASGILVPDSLYKLNTITGQIRGSRSESLPVGKYTISYQYYPVYQSKYIRGTPYTTDSKDADVFDGVTLVFNNPWSVAVDTTSTWITNKLKYRFAMSPVEIYNGDQIFIAGYAKPCDYELQFDTTKVLDTSYADPNLGSDAIPTNFRVYNRTEKKFVQFTYNYSTIKTVPVGRLVPSEELYLYELNPRGTFSYSWVLGFSSNDQKPIPYDKNDTLRIFTTKPFEQGDTLTFSTTKAALASHDSNKKRLE